MRMRIRMPMLMRMQMLKHGIIYLQFALAFAFAFRHRTSINICFRPEGITNVIMCGVCLLQAIDDVIMCDLCFVQTIKDAENELEFIKMECEMARDKLSGVRLSFREQMKENGNNLNTL